MSCADLSDDRVIDKMARRLSDVFCEGSCHLDVLVVDGCADLMGVRAAKRHQAPVIGSGEREISQNV